MEAERNDISVVTKLKTAVHHIWGGIDASLTVIYSSVPNRLSVYRGFVSFTLFEFHDSQILPQLQNSLHPDFCAHLLQFLQSPLPISHPHLLHTSFQSISSVHKGPYLSWASHTCLYSYRICRCWWRYLFPEISIKNISWVFEAQDYVFHRLILKFPAGCCLAGWAASKF